MIPQINTDDDWLRESTTLSKNAPAIDSLSMVRLLTTPSENCLDNLSDRFETIGTEAYDKFLKNLNFISEEIEARNEEAEKANKAPYNYLNPSNERETAWLVAGVINCRNLTSLYLSDNELITEAGLRSLSTLFQSDHCRLECLFLDGLNIDTDGIGVLVVGLASLPTLKKLDLEYQ
eukprot:scaffold15109_cov70-Skeletonema_dohrnii-CCMP3373.AAC.2